MTPAGLHRLLFDETVGGVIPLKAYLDTATPPNWTIGVGCTGPDIGPSTVWTLAQAQSAFAQRIADFEAGLRNRFTWFELLQRDEPVRADVLVNIAFNIGITGLSRWPVTLAAVRTRDWGGASADIEGNAEWGRQVHERRERCAAAMGGGSWGDAPTAPDVPAPDDASGASVEVDL